MAYGRRAFFGTLREAAFGSVGAGYTALGGAFTDYARIVSIFNSTDQDIYVSFNGSTNHMRVASGSGQVLDLCSNEVRDDGFFLPIGTVIYQKRVSGAPSTGAVWAQVVYATGGV